MNIAQFESLFSEPLRNGVSYPAATRGVGVPMVNMGEAFAYDIITDQECERVPLTSAERERFILSSGDLLFVRQSLKWAGAGRCVFVGPGSEPRTWDSHLIRARLNPKTADSRYYFYYFRSPQGRRNIESIIEQVAAAGIRGSDLRKLAIPSPPLVVQRHIADLLQGLDDKVAINDRIARTADELAATRIEVLLKDFDESKGWRKLPLASIARINNKRRSPQTDGQLRYIDISSVSIGKIAWPALSAWNDAPGRARRGVAVGDVIWSTVRPNRRAHALVLDDDPLLVASTGLAVLSPYRVGPAFLYGMTTRDEFVEYLESVAEGSAYPAVRAERFGEAPISVPPESELYRFEDFAWRLRKRAHFAEVESRSLVELRDMLLPRLMSGELRINDAERVVSDAI